MHCKLNPLCYKYSAIETLKAIALPGGNEIVNKKFMVFRKYLSKDSFKSNI